LKKDLREVMESMNAPMKNLSHDDKVKLEDAVWGTVQRPWHCLLVKIESGLVLFFVFGNHCRAWFGLA
jgi:hypothetical protein